MSKPDTRPGNPNFSSGPCAKHPGWRMENLAGALVGRSHRSKSAKAKLAGVIEIALQAVSVEYEGEAAGLNTKALTAISSPPWPKPGSISLPSTWGGRRRHRPHRGIAS